MCSLYWRLNKASDGIAAPICLSDVQTIIVFSVDTGASILVMVLIGPISEKISPQSSTVRTSVGKSTFL
jgi:hypothetical protein